MPVAAPAQKPYTIEDAADMCAVALDYTNCPSMLAELLGVDVDEDLQTPLQIVVNGDEIILLLRSHEPFTFTINHQVNDDILDQMMNGLVAFADRLGLRGWNIANAVFALHRVTGRPIKCQ